MADVFISYKSQDREWAEKVDSLIRSAGYSTWWDTSLQTGERYNDEIDRQLRQAKATVVIWSTRSWVSTWVKEEALFSRDREMLLPARIDDVEIGVPFYSLQTVDLRNWDGGRDSAPALELLASLERHVPRKLRPDYQINVYWARFNDRYVEDDAQIDRFLECVTALCASTGLELNIISGNHHIINANVISDSAQYERDLNILVYFGTIKDCGFAEDVFRPGLRYFARRANPYVLHVGHEEFDMNELTLSCFPVRRVRTRESTLPDPDSVSGDSAVEALASYIVFRAFKVRNAMENGE